VKSRDTLVVWALFAVACDGDDKSGKDTDGPDTTGDTGTAPPSNLPQVWINEVMASNTGASPDSWTDETGAFPDWVELYNPNAEAVDLSGWWLTDDRDDPFNWQIPNGVSIGPGVYLVISCDNDEEAGDNHASFSIDGLGGEDIALFGPNLLDNPLVDALEDMTIQLPDVSLARMPDGGPTWSQDDTPTPAASNN
jgi:hypothetical protein